MTETCTYKFRATATPSTRRPAASSALPASCAYQLRNAGPRHRPRLLYRTHRARRGTRRKGFTEAGYAALLDAAHQQLGGPIVLVWDNLNTHVSAAMAELIAARPRLT